jgi:hypothetical protein
VSSNPTRGMDVGVMILLHCGNEDFEKVGPPLWSSVQSSWLHIQRSGFDSRCYHIFCEVVGLERGTLSLVSIIEELLGRNGSGSGLEIMAVGDPPPDYATPFYTQKLALISSTSGGRWVGIVRS